MFLYVIFHSVFCFKDTFKLYQMVNGTTVEVPFDGKGISWWTDYNIKYRNPPGTSLKKAFEGKKCFVKNVFFQM